MTAVTRTAKIPTAMISSPMNFQPHDFQPHDPRPMTPSPVTPGTMDPDAVSRSTVRTPPGPVALCVEDCGARFALRVAQPNVAAASEAFGVDLPETIGHRAAGEGRQALCLGPDEWVLHVPEADEGERQAIVAAFAALAPTPHSLVDVSERERAIRLDGPAAAELLAVGCPIDLSRLQPGRGTRTVFDGVTVVLRRESDERFILEAWRSYVPHVWQVLVVANRQLATGL